jgi:DUF2075 family protein
MHLYSGSTEDFIADAVRSRIAQKLDDAFFEYFRYHPSPSEVRSWQNSLRAMADAVTLADLVDHGIVVELQLPLSSRRIDCLITGHDEGDRPQAVIVELKQWDSVGPSAIDDCVTVFLGNRERDALHPSRQVGNYERYLKDVHTTFSEGRLGLAACGYMHNMRDTDSLLFDATFRTLLAQYPLFTGGDMDELATFLSGRLMGGDGVALLEEVLKGKYRPHKRLLSHVSRMIANEPSYVLLDEQQVVMNHIVGRVRDRQASTERSAFLIRGGPGTGKSVIAVNLVGALAGDGYIVEHATGSKAFTENLRKTIGTRAGALFRYFNSYAKAEERSIDVLICDEAHRLRETSNSRFTKKEDRSDLPQVEELLVATNTAVFFIDDLQVVRPGEVGSAQLIRDAAARLGIPVFEHQLEAQFRCGGSEAFVGWVENTLELERNQFALWDPSEEFDFDVVDSPQELEALIRAKQAEGFSARLTAGFCWRWSAPRADGTLETDVQLDGWSMPWNAKPDAGKLAKGIPKSNYWATDPTGIDQVGCVYTAQGFEFDYTGVIFGRDLVYRPRKGWIGQPEFSQDSIVRRSAKNPDEFTSLLKNTYRVLLTRGLRGCHVFFEDEPTRDFVLSRIEWPE